jgi:hypothetical protein
MVSDALFFFTICAHLRNLRMSQNYLQQPNFYVQAIGLPYRILVRFVPIPAILGVHDDWHAQIEH